MTHSLTGVKGCLKGLKRVLAGFLGLVILGAQTKPSEGLH